jgi:hypothetical protein
MNDFIYFFVHSITYKLFYTANLKEILSPAHISLPTNIKEACHQSDGNIKRLKNF